MCIDVYIHKTHQAFTGGQAVVKVRGNTTGECLADLVNRHPGMKRVLFTEKGDLIGTMEICVNNKSAYPDQLKKQVAEGDRIRLILIIAGG